MSVYETECAQVDALIEIKQNEIKELEDLKNSWSEDSWDEPTTQTPAQVAQDDSKSSEERAAAANNVLGQSPERVNAEQSEPSPSTHDSAKEESEARYKALHEELDAEAQGNPEDIDRDKDLHSFDNGLPVDAPDGREDANKVGEAGQVDEGGTPGQAGGTVEAGTFEQEDEDKPVVDTREEESDSGSDKQAKGDDSEDDAEKSSDKKASKKGK